MNTDDFLAHHGIKGMKWGVRRTPQQLGHDVVSKVSQRIKDRKVKKGDLSALSDEELNKLINRMRLEKTYRDLAKEQKESERGIASKLLGSVKDKAVSSASSAISDAIIKAIFGDKDQSKLLSLDPDKASPSEVAKAAKEIENRKKLKKYQSEHASDSKADDDDEDD